MKKDVLLFDFGGTLDTDGIHWSVFFWELYRKFKVKVAYNHYREAFLESDRILSGRVNVNMTYKDTIKEQLKLQFAYLSTNIKRSQFLTEQLLDRMADHCYASVSGTISFTREILTSFHDAFTLGLISNFYGNLKVVLKEFDLNKLFDVVLDSVVIGFSKPDERIFNEAIRESNSAPDKAVMIGDSYDRDIVPAKNLGITTIWLDGKNWTRPDNISKADFTIHSMKELPLLVSKHFL